MGTSIIAAGLGAFAVGTGGLVWLGKTVATKILDLQQTSFQIKMQANADKEMALFRTNLQSESDRQFEMFKGQLNLRAFEHQTRFSRLHDKRLDIIMSLYKSLAETEMAFHQLMKPAWLEGEPPINELRQRAYDSAAALEQNYLYNAKLLLPSDVCEVIESFQIKLQECWFKFPHHAGGTGQSWVSGVPVEAWNAAWKTVREELPTVRKVVENHFRRLLGSDDGAPTIHSPTLDALNESSQPPKA